MKIKQKLDYPIWKIPYFFIKSLIIIIKLLKTGVLTLLIKNRFFNRRIEIFFKILNFFFNKKKEKNIGK